MSDAKQVVGGTDEVGRYAASCPRRAGPSGRGAMRSYVPYDPSEHPALRRELPAPAPARRRRRGA